MKQLLFILMLLPVIAGAQSLKRNEVDKYLKSSIKETTWENFAQRFTSATMQRMRNADGKISMEFSMSTQSAYRIDEGDRMYLLLDNDESIPIECTRGGIADYKYSKYGSHWNGKFLYHLDEPTIKKLLEHKVVGIRVGMGGEYTTFDKVKEKNAIKLQNALKLVTE